MLFPKPNVLIFLIRTSFVFFPIFFLFSVFFLACTKIDTTSLGSGLIPAVDNVHTFEMTLTLNTDNILFNDSTKMLSSDDLPLGYTNDPEFGQTKGDIYFSIMPPTFGAYPFGKKDSLVMDSVILSLAY